MESIEHYLEKPRIGEGVFIG